MRERRQLSAVPADDEPDLSTGELVRRISERAHVLVGEEIRLAKTELTAKGKRAGTGIALVALAAFLAIFGLAALFAAAGVALSLVIPGWAAALIVFGALVGSGGFLGVTGVGSIRRAIPPAPEHAIASTKEDVTTIKEAVKR